MDDAPSYAVMPHSRGAEEAFLGSLVIDPELIRRTTVEAGDFYIERNGMIFTAIRELPRMCQPVDYVSICVYLDEHKQLGEVGGPAYITSLINASPSSVNIDGYAETIKARSMRRKIILAAQRLTGAAFALDKSIDTAVSEAMESLSRTVVTNKGAQPISSFVSAVYDEVSAALQNPMDIYGIPSGIADIDRITYGWQKGEKVLLSGEPGVGKSVLAAQFLIAAARQNRAGVLYELEMSGRQVVRRALAAQTKAATPDHAVTTQKMRQGKLTDAEMPPFIHAVEIMSSLPIYISDASEMTTVEMRADLMKLKDLYDVEMVVIDYEGLLGDEPDQKDENVRSKIISKRVHDIAKDLNLAVIAIGDMTKEGIKQQVKGQGAVAGTARSLHDADQIIILRKTEQDNLVRATWEKMREGDSDRFVDLVRVPGFPMFSDVRRV
jgi:replicative DNA helicase